MYRLPPIIPQNMVVDMPTTMYKLPMIQNSNVESLQTQELTDDELKVLKQLEQRQEAILTKLEELKSDVEKLKGGAGAGSQAVSGVKDVVIRANPSHPPETLPIICETLKCQKYKVFTNFHVHSSLPKGIPSRLKDFLPISNCDSRSKADLCVTLIWTNGKETELVTSPTSSLLVKGEINFLKYFSRRFQLFNINEMTEIQIAQAESLLESVYCDVMWGAGNLDKMVSSILEPILKTSQFLTCGSKLSIADVYAFALISNEKSGKHSKFVKEWLKRCEPAIKTVKIQGSPKSPRKKIKHPKKEITGIQPGAILKHQWPETESVYMATNVMIEQIKKNHLALVSEKLDGSNLSVSSSGVIASRRKIIAVNPTIKELEATKFAGESLISLDPLLKTCHNLIKTHFQNILKFDCDVSIFGEWLQSGTASSKEDNFFYSHRGLEKGQLYAFGIGLTFEGQNLSKEALKKVRKQLAAKGFAPKIVDDNFIILVLNSDLKRLFDKHSVLTVPILQTLPLVCVFDKMANELLRHQLEGLIITIPEEGIILKWKGYEDNDPRRVGNFVDITAKCKVEEVIKPLNSVLQESILFNGAGRKRYHDVGLNKAFQSARSKFPQIGDILNNFHGNPEKKQKIIEGYKFEITEEITKDFNKAFGVTKETIEAHVGAFVRKEVDTAVSPQHEEGAKPSPRRRKNTYNASSPGGLHL